MTAPENNLSEAARTASLVEMFEPIAESRPSESLFPLRENEPGYALLKDDETHEKNRYGKLIALAELVDEATSLNINGVREVGINPNRNKQHAFHFTADNCIGCHACESACSEKNDLPPHLSFRSVGYVEGGTFPNYTRMNISMACNHCDDPVCLKGCPTRAYTKHPEYGAVIQDPDICFGCGYCTWVCPYNAPQLDPVAGQVEKCNMCVDRLEVGLKPACVSACLGNALNFGVVENTPEARTQIETALPGFPDPEITHPNIRFEQTRSLPRELTRTDSAAVKYRQDDAAGIYKPMVDKKAGVAKNWNLSRLSSRENPLVMFTLMSQTAIGMFSLLFIGGLIPGSPLAAVQGGLLYSFLVAVPLLLAALGLFMSTVHLGKPLRFYRGFNNLRHSPVAREGAGVTAFMGFSALHLLAVAGSAPMVANLFPVLETMGAGLDMLATASGLIALLGAGVGLYYMYRCYRIKARPFWDHAQTGFSFVGSSIALGAAVTGVTLICASLVEPLPLYAMLQLCTLLMAAGLCIEGLGLMLHARDMKGADSEGAVSHYVQTTTFGKTYLARNIVLAILLLTLLMAPWHPEGPIGISLFAALSLSVLVLALVGRALFYVLVVPTTMPGAFFWKNKAFEEHARDIGLADMPQVGVAPLSH
jgi:DMSO reductase iron-sulfur subunit